MDENLFNTKLIERTAQCIAHRACCGSEHNPQEGKLHGYCVVCGVAWPCEYVGKKPEVIDISTAKFTNEELEYIYGFLDYGANKELYRTIENKIRNQIPKYVEFDEKKEKEEVDRDNRECERYHEKKDESA